jgi:hypothetical protein
MVAHRNSGWQNCPREIQQHRNPGPPISNSHRKNRAFLHWIYIHYQVPVVGYVSLGNPIFRKKIPLSNIHKYSQYKGIQYQSPTNHQWLHDDNSWESPTWGDQSASQHCELFPRKILELRRFTEANAATLGSQMLVAGLKKWCDYKLMQRDYNGGLPT